MPECSTQELTFDSKYFSSQRHKKPGFFEKYRYDLHKETANFAAIHNISLNDFVKTAISYALLHKEDVNKRIHPGIG